MDGQPRGARLGRAVEVDLEEYPPDPSLYPGAFHFHEWPVMCWCPPAVPGPQDSEKQQPPEGRQVKVTVASWETRCTQTAQRSDT